MDSKIYKLLLKIEEFLIVYITESTDYKETDTVKDFMNKQPPEIQALYECFLKLSEKYFPEEGEC